MSLPPPTEKQARIIWNAATGFALAVIAALVAVLIWALGKGVHLLAPVLWPIAIAAIVSYLLDPVVDFMAARRVPRQRAIVLVFALAVTIVLGIAGGIIPQLVRESQELLGRIPGYAENAERKIDNWINHPPEWVKPFLERSRTGKTSPFNPNAPAALGPVTNAPAPVATLTTAERFWSNLASNENIKTATDWGVAAAKHIVTWITSRISLVSAFFGLLAGVALVPVYVFYFLQEKEGIRGHWTDYLPMKDSPFKHEVVYVLNSVNDYLITFFRGQVLVALCNGLLYTIGFFIIGLPYALLLGVLVVPLTMIPFLGAVITCLLALTVSFASYGDMSHPMLVLVVVCVVQTIESFMVQPKIIGDRVGLHPLSIIIAVMAGTTLLGGVLGGLLAIPLTAALRVLMFHYVWKKPEGYDTMMLMRPKSKKKPGVEQMG
ncbi:MAG: AI-2E family transporter [Verrucomicrobia bacterium]|nr:AI-2E family transporter [Verrucomicrobiota bacterium]